MLELCNEFKISFDNDNKINSENDANNNILMRDYIDRKPDKKISNNQHNNMKNDNKRFERFGGKPPFSHNVEKEDNMDIDDYSEKDNKENPQENYIIYKKPSSYSADRDKKDKDPMVWDPPEDKKIINNKIVKKNQNVVQKGERKVSKPQNIPIDVDKKRNYEKPWKLPEEKKVKEKDPKENKSAFLLHCYPDGVGPDSDLIEMLERDVVDTNPNVKFDDIAELDNAKNVLKESVLLPLIIPDFFKVIIIIN